MAIPRMSELVRKKSSFEQARAWIDQSVLRNAIVAALVMLLAEAHDVVAEGEKKMVIAIVMGTIEGVGFVDEPRIIFEQGW